MVCLTLPFRSGICSPLRVCTSPCPFPLLNGTGPTSSGTEYTPLRCMNYKNDAVSDPTYELQITRFR